MTAFQADDEGSIPLPRSNLLPCEGMGHTNKSPTYFSGVSTMDSTMSFYLMNVGSIPARRTSFVPL